MLTGRKSSTQTPTLRPLVVIERSVDHGEVTVTHGSLVVVVGGGGTTGKGTPPYRICQPHGCGGLFWFLVHSFLYKLKILTLIRIRIV